MRKKDTDKRGVQISYSEARNKEILWNQNMQWKGIRQLEILQNTKR